MGIMSLMALYHIHIGSRVTELNRYYAKQLKQQKQLKHTHKELQYALARLRDPKRLKQVARQELGMQQTEASQILPIDQINNLLNRSASASHTHLAKSNKSHKNDTKK
jgi:cell division protein FtsL